MGKIIFLSPHFDDVVFSCAGLIQEYRQKSIAVDIVTVFSEGDENRKQEDQNATQVLDCQSYALGFQDAPIRRGRPDVLFQNISEESQTLENLVRTFKRIEAEAPTDSLFFAPLGIGWHVDHILTFEAAANALPFSKLRFYEDSPYNQVKFQTELRLGSNDSDQLAIFSQEFFKAKYVKTYLSDWTPQVLNEKMNRYPHLKIAQQTQLNREIVLSDSMIARGHLAKTQYLSQNAFYDTSTYLDRERYYEI